MLTENPSAYMSAARLKSLSQEEQVMIKHQTTTLIYQLWMLFALFRFVHYISKCVSQLKYDCSVHNARTYRSLVGSLKKLFGSGKLECRLAQLFQRFKHGLGQLSPLNPFPASTLVWLKQLCFLQIFQVSSIMHSYCQRECIVIVNQKTHFDMQFNTPLDNSDGTEHLHLDMHETWQM